MVTHVWVLGADILREGRLLCTVQNKTQKSVIVVFIKAHITITEQSLCDLS